LLPLKVYDDASKGVSMDAVVDAINYAAALNVPILNMSLSFSYTTSALQLAINSFPGLIVASAGNSNVNIDLSGNQVYPACLTNSNIITVGGINNSYTNLYNYGTTSVDLVARGYFNAVFTPLTVLTDGMKYCSGTSFSAPLVTGTAALIKSAKPGASISQIKAAILSGVDIVSGLSTKCATSGKLNCLKAFTYFTIYGDVNNDGLINQTDYDLVHGYIVNRTPLTTKGMVAADVNRDGMVSMSDMFTISSHIEGRIKINQN